MPNENADANLSLNKEVVTFLEIIPNFDGNVKVLNDFITSTEEVIDIINQTNPSEITKSFIILSLKKKIIGNAKELLSGININSWRELKNILIQNYEDKRNEATLLIEICELKQSNEPISVFLKKYTELFLLFNSKIEIRLLGNELKNMHNFGQLYTTQCFIKNCKEPFRSQLSARSPKTLGEISELITNDLQYIHTQQKTQLNTHPNFYQNPKTPVQFKTPKFQSPMQRYPTQHVNYQPKQFAPQANARNAAYRNPTPMSIQTRQYPTQNFNKNRNDSKFVSEELFNQNLENSEELQNEVHFENDENICIENENENIDEIENVNFPILESPISNP